MHWDTVLTVLLQFGFALAMLASATLDLRSRRLPNWLNLAVAMGFLPWAWSTGLPWNDVAIHLVVGAMVLAVGFGLFATGVIGGGDAKLGAAVALWIGFSSELLRFFIAMALAGGVLAIFALIWQAAAHQRLTRALPYGVAIGVAGLDYLFRHSEAACFFSGC